MEKIIYIIIIALLQINLVSAQSKKRVPLNWQNNSFSIDRIYGASINRAYDYLNSVNKKPKKKIVVAVIDGGIDDLHEDLKDVLWTNTKEIPNNGIDDDKNGYVDDIHGWNFIKNGNKEVQLKSLCADREFMRLKDKYVFKSPSEINKRDLNEYNYFKNVLGKNSEIGKKYSSILMMNKIWDYARKFDKELKAKYPGKEITSDMFSSGIVKDNDCLDKQIAVMYLSTLWSMRKQMGQELTWKQILSLEESSKELSKNEYKNCINKFSDNRNKLGDALNNIKDYKYGCNELCNPSSNHGTHVAGIIGAKRGNDIGMDGVADNVELMVISAIPEGDEYDKDVALAIKYAVDNGADIINMSFGKNCSPHKKWVEKYLKLAQRKNVLVLHGAGNSYSNIDTAIFYPNGYIKNKKLNNFITVGAIDAQGNPGIFSCFGKKEVDIFAPGVEIYSTVIGDNYQKMSGTSMATPVVSGVAALIWSYYPELKAKELKEILLKSVTKIEKEVLMPQNPRLVTSRKKTQFSNLCNTGGIINAYKAVKMAESKIK